MTYRVDVWIHHGKEDSFESDNAKEIDEWIRNNYIHTHNHGDCAIYVYKNEIDLSLTEMEKEGITVFYDVLY